MAAKKILLVDDTESVVNSMESVMVRIFDPESMVFHTDPHEALAEFLAKPEEFGLIISDVDMPGLSGAEMVQKMRDVNPSIKVIMWSGEGHPELDISQYDGFFSKPVSPREVIELARQLLSE